MRHTPKAQEIYRHFKGKLYQIITVAKHSETGEPFVVYQAMYGGFQTYVRPLEMFMDKTDRAKYPDALQEYRFELVDFKDDAKEYDYAGEGNSSTIKEVSGRQDERKAMKSGMQADYGPGIPSAGERPGFAAVPSADVAGGGSLNEEAEELNIDPMVLEFLDASTYGERLNILAGLHYRITDDMIDVMAMATDIEVRPGDIEERYVELRNCLIKLEKYECNRLRS